MKNPRILKALSIALEIYCTKNFAICPMQLYNFFLKTTVCFSLYQFICFIILCIKILRYSYQKMNSLRDILHFMSKCVNLSTHISKNT